MGGGAGCHDGFVLVSRGTDGGLGRSGEGFEMRDSGFESFDGGVPCEVVDPLGCEEDVRLEVVHYVGEALYGGGSAVCLSGWEFV